MHKVRWIRNHLYIRMTSIELATALWHPLLAFHRHPAFALFLDLLNLLHTARIQRDASEDPAVDSELVNRNPL